MIWKRRAFDIISIGDTTLDIFLELREAKVECDHGQEDCWLCVAYPEKVPVSKVTKIPAVGNSANVAVGSSRLGVKTAFYTILGNDLTAKESFARLKSEGVRPDYIRFDKTKSTNFSAVLNFKGDRTILVFHEQRRYELPKLAPASWVYLSSIAAGHEKLHEQVLAYLEKSGAKLGFNPGTHQLKEGLRGLRPMLKKTAVLLVNKEEAELLVGKRENVKELLADLKDEGPEVVVITDGPKGSYSFAGSHFYFQDVLEVPVVERTGCGDSYSTGFVVARLLGRDIPEAMRWGTVNAAFVLQKIGAQEGLLRRAQLLKVLADNPQLQTKEI